MSELSTPQMLYLLYAVAYSEEGTVTKGTVKPYLPKKLRNDAELIYDALLEQKLIESPKRYRLSVTEQGMKALIDNLKTTNYKFDSQKGPKVPNAIIHCLQLALTDAQTSSASVEDMDFDTFVEKFKKLYFEERKHQELRGVVAIHSIKMTKKFMEHHPISRSQLDTYFDRLKSTGKVFAVTEKDEELIQWVE